MSRLPDPTPQQAEAAIKRVRESVALTSGAGCGKTFVLARRFTELLLQAGKDDASPLESFVALTFTDKAALEMTWRVRRVLLDALENSRAPADRQRLADWIMELPAAHISTIHSFCASLLRRHAIAAGVDPAFAVSADDLLTAQMRSDAAEEAILAAVEAWQPDIADMLARAELDKLKSHVQALLDRPMAWRPEDYTDAAALLACWRGLHRQRLEALRQELRDDAGLQQDLEHLRAVPCTDKYDKLHVYRQETLAVLGQHLRAEAGDWPARAALGKPGNVGKAKCWGGREALLEYRRLLAGTVERFSAALAPATAMNALDEQAAADLVCLARLAGQAAQRYSQVKRRAGMLDFDDLITLTARLLRDKPDVRAQLRRRLGQLMIDECQDTDSFQLAMLWNLLADGAEPPPGKLFIVGDIKQSIYRFRGAQAEVFNDLCRRFGTARLPLNESFRTHRAGVAFVNELFGRLMKDYEPIVSRRPELPEGPSVEILLAAADDPDGQEADFAQADLVAQRIAELIGGEQRVWDSQAKCWRKVRKGDIAVLFSRMTNLLGYERAFQQRDIDYYVVAGTGFFRQQEVYDLLNALRAIDNPYDDLSLLGLLRSNVFGLTDNTLLAIATRAHRPYFDKLTRPEVLAAVAPAQRQQLSFASELLARLHRHKDGYGPAGVIQRLLEQTGYAAVLLSQFHGRKKLGNVQRLLDSARSAQAGGQLTLADFVQRFSEQVLAEPRMEQAAVVGEQDDVVRIMTIHKAKGLEFPVVILPDLDGRFRRSVGRLLFRQDWGLTYNPHVDAEQNDSEEAAGLAEDDVEEPAVYRLARHAEKEELAAEDVRRLYVGMTRHMDHLVLIGQDCRTRDGQFPRNTYLRRLDEAMGEAVSRAAEAGSGEFKYGDGFSAAIRRATPERLPWQATGQSLGQRLCADAANAAELAEQLLKDARPASLPLAGPIELTAGASGVFAATALGDFQHCPMLYRWRYELRVQPPAHAMAVLAGDAASVPPAPPAGLMDAATAGTLFHRCMELLDMDMLAAAGGAGAEASAIEAVAAALASAVLAEAELEVAPAQLEGDLAEMLGRLVRHELWHELAGAKHRLRELSFLARTGSLEIAGQIDLLYQDAGGAWHIVDYKSDRIAPAQAAEHASRYELQMLIYLDAARRHLGTLGRSEQVADATLYFLRAGCTHRFAADAGALGGAKDYLDDIARRLTASRRSRQYQRRSDGQCSSCPYGAMCLR